MLKPNREIQPDLFALIITELKIKGITVMTTKAKVKIIKKSELKNVETPAIVEKKPTQAAREMVSTVTNWVSDFQQRRREETKQAFEKFFSAQPQPGEM